MALHRMQDHPRYFSNVIELDHFIETDGQTIP